MLVYKSSNGYGKIDVTIDTNQFLGKKLEDAKNLYQNARYDVPISNQEVMRLCNNYIELGKWASQLASDYDIFKKCLLEPGKYQYVNDGHKK